MLSGDKDLKVCGNASFLDRSFGAELFSSLRNSDILVLVLVG
jgi:hypothetical protein